MSLIEREKMKKHTFVQSYLKRSKAVIILMTIAIVSAIIMNNYDLLILLFGILSVCFIPILYFFRPKNIKLENYIISKEIMKLI